MYVVAQILPTLVMLCVVCLFSVVVLMVLNRVFAPKDAPAPKLEAPAPPLLEGAPAHQERAPAATDLEALRQPLPTEDRDDYPEAFGSHHIPARGWVQKEGQQSFGVGMANWGAPVAMYADDCSCKDTQVEAVAHHNPLDPRAPLEVVFCGVHHGFSTKISFDMCSAKRSPKP